MTTVETTEQPPADVSTDEPAGRLPRLTGRRADLLVALLALLGGLWVTARLWTHPAKMLANFTDEVLFEWMFAHAAHAVVHLDNPLLGDGLNYPAGIDLMANTSVLGLAIPLVPVTLLLGPHASFLIALTLAVAGTAFAWYLLLNRVLGASRPAALVGGAFAGFAPGSVSQANGHLHIAAGFLLPAVIWALLRLRTPDQTVRRGLILGLLVVVQSFLSEETLLFAGLGFAGFLFFYAIFRRDEIRAGWLPFLKAGAVAAVVAGVLLAYPLWFQFAGPQHYTGTVFEPTFFETDLTGYGTHATQSLANLGQHTTGPTGPGATEENASYGYALIALIAVIVVWLWRSVVVKALALTCAVFVVFSFGARPRLDGKSLGVPGPYRLIEHLPLLDLALADRLPLVITPMLAILLAMSVDRAREFPFRRLWLGAVVAVLLPLVPLPLHSSAVPPVPRFISSGEWRQYVAPGRTVVPIVPTAVGTQVWGMYWSGRTELAFNAPGGYFIGPTGPNDPRAHWGAPDTAWNKLLYLVSLTGTVPTITDEDRTQAVEALRAYRGAVVVLGEMPHERALRDTLTQFFGPGTDKGDAWIWDVRALTD